MNALKSLNKEQWTAVAALGLAVLLLSSGLAGGLSVSSDVPPAGTEIPYQKLPGRYVELPDEKFERYWKNGFGPKQTASRLPAPYLRAPEPREMDLAAPLFRPAPSTEGYLKSSGKAKYPVLIAGAPLIPEGQLPPAAELQALAKLPEPEIATRPDRREERERPQAVVKLNNNKEYVGEVLAETTTLVKFKIGTGTQTFQKSEIRELLTNYTFLELYKKESAALPPGPKGGELRLKLARKLLDWGMLREAREELARALEVRKDLLDGLLLSIQLMVEASDFEGALAAIDGAEEFAGSADLLYERGRILQLLNIHDGAALAFEKAVEASPRHAAARVGLARAQLNAGRAAQAETTALNFLQNMGTLPDVPARLKADGYYLRGRASFAAGAVDKAKNDAGEALKLEPQHAEATNLMGAALALDGAWQAAAGEFVKAIKADPYLTDAWTNLANLCMLAGKWADAEALYAAASQRDPASAEAVAGLGTAQWMAGRKEAAATLQRAVGMDPRHVGALLTLGQLHLRDEANDAALGRFREALAADPYHLPSYAGAAAAYLRTARELAAQADAVKLNEERAAPLFKQAGERRIAAEMLVRTIRDFEPGLPGPWTALGCAYAGMGRPEDARQALRMAANLLQQANRPIDPLIYYGLGYVEYYYGAGESEEARMTASLPDFQAGAKLRDAFKDPFYVKVAAECEAVAEAIEEWKITSLRFEETFEREPNKSLGAQWIESDGTYGVAVTVEKSPQGGRAKLAGRQAIKGWGMTSMLREIPGANFLSFEATLYPEKAERAEYGMSIYYNEQGGQRPGFHVGVDAQGKLRFNSTASDPRDMDGKDMVLGWTEIKTPIPNPAELRIRITKIEKNRQSFLTISIWDASKGQWVAAHRELPVNLANVKESWRAGVFVRAALDADVSVWADNLRVYERLK